MVNTTFWRGMVVVMILTLNACSGGASPQSTTTEPPPAPEPTRPRPTVAFVFPTETTSPTPTPLPSGPFTWRGGQRPLFMAHYMPWYQSQAYSGSWGWHWTMDRFMPRQNEDGTWSGLASHYTPLLGPYDSRDPDVLATQMLWIKISGIDGVIVDWYGMEDFRDYAMIEERTAALLEAVQSAGLKFVICYEDQTVKHMVDQGHIRAEDAAAHGQAVMRYLKTRYFGSDAYLKVDDQPVLLTFGPQYYKRGEDWQALFDGLDTQPLLVTLDRHAVSGQAGSYPWPPMWAAPGAELPVDRLASYLDGFYQQAASYAYRVGGAFPGFHDIYAQAGVSGSHGSLDAQDGKTLRYTLQAALNQPLDMIQLITWNDYGEGTMIEPTLETGLRDLETVQEARRATDSAFAYGADDLRLPHAWYTLRVQHAGDAHITAQLDDAYAAAVTGDLPAAWEIITGLQ